MNCTATHVIARKHLFTRNAVGCVTYPLDDGETESQNMLH